MTKIGILADTHLIHAYHRDYDKIQEFERLVDSIIEQNPNIILVLGDLFDNKFTSQSHPISHIEGSKHQIPIVEIIKNTGIDWYALLGNHEDSMVLKSIAQASPNFYYMKTNPEISKNQDVLKYQKPLEIENAILWFANINMDKKFSQKEGELKKFCQSVSKYPNSGKKNILLTHLDFIRRAQNVGLEDNILKTLSTNFDLILNGHEHTYLKKYKFDNIVIVPPSMPSWIMMGSGSIQNFSYEQNKLVPKNKLKTPHGFLIVDDETLEHQFFPFKPYMPSIEILYDVSGKNLPDIDENWRSIAGEVKTKFVGNEGIASLIIIPIFTGNMEHLYKLDVNRIFQIISNEMDRIFITNMRDRDLVTTSFSIKKTEGEEEFLNIGKVFAKTLEQLENIQEQLKKKEIKISNERITEIILRMKALDRKFFYKRGKNTINKYISDIIESLLPQFNDILNKSYLPIDIISILEVKVKKKV